MTLIGEVEHPYFKVTSACNSEILLVFFDKKNQQIPLQLFTLDMVI